MTYELILGDPAYSSWSMRAWLLLDHFALPFQTRWVQFSDVRSVAAQLPDLAPARTVPILVTADAVIPDTLAIAEELASRHPQLGLWPKDPAHRAVARSLVAEMHSSFSALRTDCPMNLRSTYAGFSPSDAVQADVARIAQLWQHARTACSAPGPWLCGDYGIVDAFFAPVAARIAGYSLPVPQPALAYVQAHLAHPGFRKWRANALTHGPDLPRYARDLPLIDWPG